MADILKENASRIIDSIKKNSDNFSVVDTLSQAVTNKQFLDGKLQLDAGNRNSYTYIWTTLSAIGQDIGETLYSNVLNYIDNVSNIDVCKITALKSMLKAYGIKYTLFDNLAVFPSKIADMLDLLSVNKKYLLDSKAFDIDFIINLISRSNGVAYSLYNKQEKASMLYKIFRTVLTVSDEDHNMPYEGTYTLCNDYSYDDPTSNSIVRQGINICREYICQPVKKIYYNFNEIGQLPDNFNPNNCIEQLSAEFTATYKIKKFNLLVEKDYGRAPAFHYGLFETNKHIKYYWKDNNHSLVSGEVVQSPETSADEMIGIMHDFEGSVNVYSDERIAFGPIFNDMYVSELSNRLYPFAETDADIAQAIAVGKTSILSSIANYSRINALSGINSTEFSVQFENKLNNKVNDTLIDDTTYFNFLSSIYYCHLSTVCNMAYINEDTIKLINTVDASAYINLSQPIYQLSSVSAEFFQYSTKNILSSNEDTKKFKQQNSIDLKFDEKAIVDNIEVGADYIDNYAGAQRTLLENEIETRKQQLFDIQVGELSSNIQNNIVQTVMNTTRTNYYRKEMVKHYVKFIEQCNYANDSNIFLSKYDIDNDYMIIDEENNKYKQLIVRNDDETLSLDYNMIENVAKFLADFTMYITGIREKMKTQAIRYYMKGTFNLLSYIVNEYLIEFSKNNNVLKYIFDENSSLRQQYLNELSSSNVTEEQIMAELTEIKSRLSAHMYENVKVVEYDDYTEYFNLSSSTSHNALNGNIVNIPYWSTGTLSSFELETIQQFYIEQLKSKTFLDESQLQDFLQTLYEVGADPTYVDKKTGTLVVDGVKYNEDGSIDNQNKVQQSFSYFGTEIGYQPFYNIKNQAHPSYQVHPYMLNFMESVNSIYSIENAFTNGLVDDLIAENAVKQVNTNIGKYGQIVDIWKNNAYDFSGYRTSYEAGQHASNVATNDLVECADYDGMFYPPAIEQYMQAYKTGKLNSLVNDIKNRKGEFYNRYYKHLNLVDEDIRILADRLTTYAADISAIVEEKELEDDVYDIYKYATDKFGNSYALYKKYELNRMIMLNIDASDQVINYPQTYSTKENSLGSLWIRLKDSPIAFPAFSGANPILQKLKTENKEEIHAVWQLGDKQQGIADKMAYFYDMEFDTTKQVLFLNCWPLNYVINSTAIDAPIVDDLSANASIFRKKQYSMILICCIQQKQEQFTYAEKLYITHDAIQNIDTFSNIYNRCIQEYKKSTTARIDNLATNQKLTLDAFLGFYKTVQSTDAVFVKKNYVIDNMHRVLEAEPLIDKTNFSISLDRYTLNSTYDTYTHGPYVVDLSKFANGKYADYDISTGTVRFNYSDDEFVFGFLSQKKVSPEFDAVNYAGKHAGKGETQYPASTHGYAFPLNAIKETNSFDAFDKYVTIVDAKILNDDLIYSDINMFNLNSDASYIPQYPGLNGKNLLYKTKKYGNAKSNRYKSIELLGFSKKISDLVNKIDPNASVNYDIDLLQKIKDSIPGRVFEDYNMSLDELLYIRQNPQINSGNRELDKGEWFEWDIKLDAFTLKELAGVQILLFNSKNTGKNAYYSGTIESLSAAAAEGIEVVSENYISSDIVSEIPLSVSVAEVYAVGTFNYYDTPVNKSDTNHINNIQKIQFEYVDRDPHNVSLDEATNTKSKSSVKVKFYKNNPSQRSYIHEDTIKAVMYNKYNLRMYEFYHYFDERGIVHYDQVQDYDHAYVDIQDLVFGDWNEQVSAIDNEKSKLEDYSYLKTISSLVPNPDAPPDAKYEDRMMWKIEEKLIDSQRIYLKDIALSSYNYLSDVIVLKDMQNLSFKYSEEDVFNHSNSLFYYPGYNKIYPSLNTAMFSMSADQSIDTTGMFDQTNMYITQLEDNVSFADKIGNVDIPVQYNETECLRVFEDYDKEIDDKDPNMLQYVKFTTNDNTLEYPAVDISGITYLSIDANNYADTLDESIVNVQAHGYYGILTEKLSSDFEFNKITFNVNKNTADFKQLLDLYTSYEVMPNDKIRLYFNYYNFFNSPYVSLVNGKQQISAIEGTYLRLDPGESGLLDIIVQFKAYYGDNLYGIKNGTLMTYKIFNVSDDKPKFVLYKMSEISKGSLSELGDIDADATFSVLNSFIDLDDESNITEDGNIQVKVKLMVNSKLTLEPGAVFKLNYKLNELTFAGMPSTTQGFNCVVEEDHENETFGHITLTSLQSMSIKSITLDGKTMLKKTTVVATNVNSYDINIIESKATSVEGEDVSFVNTNGSVMFGYQVLLRKEEQDENALVEQERGLRRTPSFITIRHT